MAASKGLTLKIEGMRAAKAAFQALPETVRDGLLDATETTARELVRHAQARLASSPSIQTRALYDHVAWSINRKNGRAKAGISTGSTMIALDPFGLTHRSWSRFMIWCVGHVPKDSIRDDHTLERQDAERRRPSPQ